MSQWLLELFSEEIPARMQAGAARDLGRLAREALAAASLGVADLETFAGPRRLTLVVDGLPIAQPDRTEERKGPRVGAPEAALAGFLRSAGVDREQLEDRGGVWFATLARSGRPTAEVIAEIVPDLVRKFPWPKSMVWGSGALRWVRPLHRIVSVFDGQVTPFQVDGIASGDESEGHRVMAGGRAFRIHDLASYREGLERGFVVLDPAERARRIEVGAAALASERGLSVIPDPGLLAEVVGMAEWPVPLLGEFDPAFLDLPPEVIRTTMRTHQRYFALANASGALAPNFIAVANLESTDGGALIAKGNARVLAARLSDARFFWDEDRKVALEDRLSKLGGVTFHAKLGTMGERADRLERLARQIAPLVGADAELAARAGRLAKADLVSGMVGEFPELQGVMGGYYARAQGEDPAVAEAIAWQYRPQGPADAAPSTPVSVALALAEKLDLIVGFFAIGEKPTGSRDPFALRRAALGVLRLLGENGVRASLRHLTSLAAMVGGRSEEGVVAFILDRLKVSQREAGVRPDILEAVFAIDDDDPARISARLEAVQSFLAEPGAEDLLAGHRRAVNILAAEAKKGALPSAAPLRGGPTEEVELFDALEAVEAALEPVLDAEDFTRACALLATLRDPVDRFFEAVLVNADDPAERDNRLALLQRVQAAMAKVADFTLIQG